MLDRMRTTLDHRSALMRDGLAEHNWLRLFYLSNLVGALIICAVYLLDFSLEITQNPQLHRPLTVLILYLAAFVAWFLAEGFGVLDAGRDAFWSGLYGALGLRWLDGVLIAGAVITLVAGWRLHFLTLPLGILTGLIIVNGLIGLLTHQRSYEIDIVEAVSPEAPAGGQPRSPSASQERTV